MFHDVGTPRVLSEQLRPAHEGGAVRGQCHRLSTSALCPGNVEVFQQDSPRDTVDGQMVNDQRQLTGRGRPQRADHDPRAGVQPGPRPGERVVGQLLDDLQVICSAHRARVGDVQRPLPGAVVLDAEAQHGVPVQHGLHDDANVGIGNARRGLDDQRLVELVDRAVHTVQPAHDRRGDHRADAVVSWAVVSRADCGHPRQAGHGLFDEDVAGAAQYSGGPGPCHDPHRQDAVATQVEEGVVDADKIQAEYFGVDGGQDFLDGGGRRAVFGLPVFGRRQGAGIQFAVDRQRQRVQGHDGGGDHVGRQALGQPCARGTDVDAPGSRLGNIADQLLITGAILTDDDHGLIYAVQSC